MVCGKYSVNVSNYYYCQLIKFSVAFIPYDPLGRGCKLIAHELDAVYMSRAFKIFALVTAFKYERFLSLSLSLSLTHTHTLFPILLWCGRSCNTGPAFLHGSSGLERKGSFRGCLWPVCKIPVMLASCHACPLAHGATCMSLSCLILYKALPNRSLLCCFTKPIR